MRNSPYFKKVMLPLKSTYWGNRFRHQDGNGQLNAEYLVKHEGELLEPIYRDGDAANLVLAQC